MKGNALTKMRRSCKIAGLKLKKHAPTIMTVTGCVGVVAAAVMACKETLRLEETLDECREEKTEIEKTYAIKKDYDEKAYKKDMAVHTCKSAIRVGRLYAPAAAVGGASIALIFGSNRMMSKRNASLAAAYATLDSMFRKYRDNVKETFGEETDREMRFGAKKSKVDITTVDENGKTKKTRETVENITTDPNDPNTYGDYCRFFEESNPNWDKNAEYNMMFLKTVQTYCNDLLKANGFLFLNDVYKQLGIEPSIAGQSVGWIYDENNPIGDNYVDFGLYKETENCKRFVNGYENVILLDFNVDGDILHSPLLKLWSK